LVRLQRHQVANNMRRNRGQVLIEVIVALSVVVIAFSGALSLLGTSVGLTRTISNQYIGTYLAAEGIEIVKNMIDENYFKGAAFNANLANDTYHFDWRSTSGSGSAGDIFLNYNAGSMKYQYGGGGTPTAFKRDIIIRNSPGSPVSIEVESRVMWTGKGGDFEIVLGDRFTEWWGE